MPNWCMNRMTIKHDDPTKLDIIEEVCKAEIANARLPRDQRKDITGILGTLIPTPQELLDTESSTETPKEVYEANIAKYGYKDWYDFQIAKWGTKWDLCEVQYDRVSPTELYLTFETAWGPPTAACETLVEERGYAIHNKFCEPGCEFAGVWDNGYEYNTDIWPEYIFDDPEDVADAETD